MKGCTSVQILDVFKNHAIVCAFAAWAIAQIIKLLLYALLHRDLKAERLWGSGGMPSSHSATVCALAASVARTSGLTSAVFAVSCLLAFVVMYDAMGVRRAAGEHAKAINRIAELQEEQNEDFFLKDLKELLGHTPIEVIAGAALGVFIGLIAPLPA